MSIVLDNADKLEPWINEHASMLKSGADAKEGDVVLCSCRNNWGEPTVMGKVMKVHKKGIKLPKDHPDGDKGFIFVLPFEKQRLAGRKTLKGFVGV